MIRNYFFLNRFVIESGKLLKDSTIESIFSQEKDKLILELRGIGERIFVEIFVHPTESYINIRKSYSRARKNTINFFPALLTSKINGISISEDDRIIRIHTNRGNLYFTIRGKFTNAYFISADGELTVFKKTDEGNIPSLKKELNTKKYSNDFNIPRIQISDYKDTLEVVRTKHPVISREIILEVKRRASSSNPSELLKTLESVLYDIRDLHPAVFINESKSEIFLSAETFGIFDYTTIQIFDDLITAQNFYLAKKYHLSEKSEKLKLIRRQLENDLKKISNKINKLKVVIDAGSKEEVYRKYGNLILINLSSIKPGMDTISVDDTFSQSDTIKIKLDPKLSPRKNADRFFEKSKAERINYQKSKELLIDSENQFNKLKELETKVSDTEDLKDIKQLMKELRIKDKPDAGYKDEIKIKFRQYIIDGKYKLFVGKDSKNNDLLTTRFAKQNDYWFHARGASGSHTVLRVDNSKEPVPKNILKKAASIAAYHSKAKTSGIVPVVFTFKKYVVKKKGDPVGTVHLLREDVLLVKPEIPPGCEYVSNEEVF